ncbi:MAG: ExeM/NucH family extracellular endonuclease [Trueperaceae bacterium]
MPRRFAPVPLILAVVATVAVLVARIGPGDVGFSNLELGVPGRCGEAATPVHAVQGPGSVSPLEGDAVIIEAIVTATYQGHETPIPYDLGGYAVQMPDAMHDNDPRTSEGVFVADARRVEVGRTVRLRGTVRERHGQTVIMGVQAIRVCDEGPATVTPVSLPFPLDDPAALEALEGMRVVVPSGVIAGAGTYARFGELWIAATEEVPLTPTQRRDPGPEAAEQARAQRAQRILFDDGRDAQNPSPPRHPDGAAFGLEHRFRVGDTLHELHGVITHAFGTHRMHPAGPPPRYRPTDPRPPAPDPVGGELRVASMNAENLFVTLQDDGDRCGPGGDRACRGAANAEERERQWAKVVAALARLDADVIALQEIENHPDDAALRALATALNERLAEDGGADRYREVATGLVGMDVIVQGFLYRAGAVEPDGPPIVQEARAFVDPVGHGLGGNRPALGQRFVPAGGGDAFTVVALHLKSKGSSCGPNDDDPIQGACAATRTGAVDALLHDLQARPGVWGDRVLVTGDLNAYPREDAARRMVAGPDGTVGTDDDLIDLLDREIGPSATTYVHDGRAGRLDHAFATPALAADVTGATVWSANAREPSVLDASTRFKAAPERALFAPDPFRSSDHDPVLIGIGR